MEWQPKREREFIVFKMEASIWEREREIAREIQIEKETKKENTYVCECRNKRDRESAIEGERETERESEDEKGWYFLYVSDITPAVGVAPMKAW